MILRNRFVLALAWVGLAYATAIGIWYQVALFQVLGLVACAAGGWWLGKRWDER